MHGRRYERLRGALMALVAVVAVLLSTARGSTAGMGWGQSAAPVPLSALTNVRAVGVSATSGTIYVANASGLYRSSAAPYTSWTVVQTLAPQEAATNTIVALAPHPQQADDLLYATAAGTVYRSGNGGRTAVVTTIGPLTNTVSAAQVVRAPSTPTTIYVGGSTDNGSEATIYRSTDDGRAWTRVFPTIEPTGDMGVNTITTLVVDAHNADHVLAGGTGYHGGFAVESRDGGRTWHAVQAGPALASPDALALNPVRPAELWASWSVMGEGELDHSLDSGHTWQRVAVTLPPAPAHTHYALSGGMPVVYVPTIQADPLTGRVYLVVGAVLEGGHPGPSGVYTARATASWERGARGLQWDQFAPPGGAAIGWPLALVPNGGYLLTSVSDGRAAHLGVFPLVGSRTWPVSAALRTYYSRHSGLRNLGYPIAPSRLCHGAVCQVFDKGCLEERSPGVYGDNPLVADLLAARATLPVGGITSTVSYKTLAALHGQQTRPPAGFRQGTAPVPGGRFIPSSPQLRASPGYVVPTYFWQYMTQQDTMPDGWLQDLGLPLTKAIRATVTKGALGRHVIVVQAFQDAILTYDARNPPAWRVERANSGADYARVFPQAVR
jgi:hypothetical protein